MENARRVPDLGPGLWCSVPLAQADEDGSGYPQQLWNKVGTTPGREAR